MFPFLSSVFFGNSTKPSTGDSGKALATLSPARGLFLASIATTLSVLGAWFLYRPLAAAPPKKEEDQPEQPKRELQVPPPKEEQAAPKEEEAPTAAADDSSNPSLTLSARYERLAEHLASPDVKVDTPEPVKEEPEKLTGEEVVQVFKKYVPGVEEFLYREQYGVYALSFIRSGYTEGFRAFAGTPLHAHLLSLLRLIVHHGYADGPNAATHLQEVAEAFMDCQAVQARVVEKVGLEIRGVRKDFRGHVVGLAAEYKAMALRMLAYEEVTKLGGPDAYQDPNHFENRLIADIGAAIGFGAADIERASADSHARDRWRPLSRKKRGGAIERFRKLFEVDAFLKAFVAELNSFSESSEADSLPMQFLEWSKQNIVRPHDVMDEESCSRVSVSEDVALAVLEVLFFGSPSCAPDGPCHRGSPVRSLFKS